MQDGYSRSFVLYRKYFTLRLTTCLLGGLLHPKNCFGILVVLFSFINLRTKTLFGGKNHVGEKICTSLTLFGCSN